ncbi:unnamed protein product, partial [Mesorhabditis belari]|uniref:Uncharacterized protein n=1 Tax=Mesorhabditis belari TaxID=2138241 RepID=A0AAF3FQL9_9BILA
MSRLFLFAILFYLSRSQDNPFDLEFSPFVYKLYRLPFKTDSYAQDWYGQDVALIQSPLLAPIKQSKPGRPLPLPTIRPFTVNWRHLEDTHVNDENNWNFEKRIDSKVWWPTK